MVLKAFEGHQSRTVDVHVAGESFSSLLESQISFDSLMGNLMGWIA